MYDNPKDIGGTSCPDNPAKGTPAVQYARLNLCFG